MKKNWIWIWLVLPLAANAANDIVVTSRQMQTLGVSVSPLTIAGPVMSNRLPGEVVVPVGQERIVSAPQSGLIDSLRVVAGQTVKRGQALAHLTSPELVAMQRDYLQSRTRQRLATNMMERDRELFKDGIIAERRLLTTQSAHEEQTVLLAQRRQALKMAGLGEESLNRLENTGKMAGGLTIAAPIDGVVLEQMATVGQRVDASAPIYRIGRLKPLWLEIHAPIDILHFAKNGMRIVIPQYQAEGSIITILRSINKNDQTVHLRAEITSGAEKLSPGQYVEAELAAEAGSRQFSVSKAAVVRSGQKSYLFVRTAQGFRALPVTVISEQTEHAVVSGELDGSEKVAVTGTAAIKAAWAGIGGE
ncbi:MAG TPA: efflux RND transporter periplasmic adaptor subunit [Novimethylophilus sp.]|uniref:efflux RND transporter periplasmic adaptor subunit n=1 Tax=Novimethylophilus sp. TaxID=2137426 RepID=UPI002F3FDA5A